MKTQTKHSVLRQEGYFFEGEIPGSLCFVPLTAIKDGKLDEGRYVQQEWASLNIKAQSPRSGIGSHLFPNMEKPCSDTDACGRLKTRLEALRPQLVPA
jgi:hypothetical protein